MKTPIQELIDWVRTNLPMDLDYSQKIESKCLELLEKEKQVIINAWYDGASSDPLPTHKNAEHYYEKNYGKHN